jgi:hypothetical protein
MDTLANGEWQPKSKPRRGGACSNGEPIFFVPLFVLQSSRSLSLNIGRKRSVSPPPLICALADARSLGGGCCLLFVVVRTHPQAALEQAIQRRAEQEAVPAEMRRMMADAYAAQMEAANKAEDAMIRKVQQLTIIERLPVTTYTQAALDNLGMDERECPICMVEYQVADEIRFLPCMHVYHTKCVDDWLTRSFSCPVCGDSLSNQLMDL